MNTIFIGKDIDEVYYDICDRLYRNPDFTVSPRGQKIHEILNARFTIEDPRATLLRNPIRKMSERYLAGELFFYLSGSNKLDTIAHYSDFWRKLSDDGKTVNSAYGKRLWLDQNKRSEDKLTQFQYAKQMLKLDKDTRKAILMIYSKEDAKQSNDNPCTVYLQFFIRCDKLYLIVNMRSNDVWLGVPYDVAFFTLVQQRMLCLLRNEAYPQLELGTYTHNAGSLHLYENNIEKVKELITSKRVDSEVWPEWKMLDEYILNDALISEENYRKYGPGYKTLFGITPELYVGKLLEMIRMSRTLNDSLKRRGV